ncbi:MAG: ATP-binding protein [Bacteroidales bacterium]|jgi:DNA helicase HerA-like ATPase|nr:ATP-binding protein [Bacteroidales bacterium]
MAIFQFKENSEIGTVFSVDTATLIVKVDELEKLRKLQVNHLVAIVSSKAGQHLIGIINRITRKMSDDKETSDEDSPFGSFFLTENIIKVNLIGTLMDKYGSKENVFKRNLDTVPEIEAKCFHIDGENMTKFMTTISNQEYETPLTIGKYSIDANATAFLDGDKLFQRHAVIVGSTGSGKSWCVAKFIEQIAKLSSANCILFDIHGEYSGENFKMNGIQHLRVANPSDLGKTGNLENNVLMLPYWLLTYEEMLAMLLDRSDSNAPNQAMLFSKTVFDEKEKYLDSDDKNKEFKGSITIDSPVPYKLNSVLAELKRLDEKMVAGAKAGTEKQGTFFGKLTRFVQRLEAKQQDKRMGFLFQISEDELKIDWMNDFCKRLMSSSEKSEQKAGVKIIDFSEVPSDVLPLIISLVARIIFAVQQWTNKENQHPIALLCDEAHLYIPERTNQDATSELGLKSFERIAKEGRKYGVSLVVISQRPSEVNHTVLSQCNNFISLRLTNVEDQSVIKKLLPDNLAGLTEVLPILDIGEALVVGDASLLPTRVQIDEPTIKPDSVTIKFWEIWSKKDAKQDIENAVKSLRKQAKPHYE